MPAAKTILTTWSRLDLMKSGMHRICSDSLSWLDLMGEKNYVCWEVWGKTWDSWAAACSAGHNCEAFKRYNRALRNVSNGTNVFVQKWKMMFTKDTSWPWFIFNPAQIFSFSSAMLFRTFLLLWPSSIFVKDWFWGLCNNALQCTMCTFCSTILLYMYCPVYATGV